MNSEKSNNTIQAFWIGIGSLFSFGFSLISAAILSRYLTKDEYGTYKQIMYVYNTLLVVFTLGLPRAYSFFLPRVGLNEGKNLIKKINLCFVVLGFLFSGILYICSDAIAQILNNENLSIPLKIFSPTPLFLLPTMGLEGIMATFRKTEWNAIYSISTRLISLVFVAMPVIFYKADCNIAILGFTISSIFTCAIGVYLMYLPFKNIASNVKASISYKEIFTFSWPLMFAGFWGIAEKAAGQFYISRWFGEATFADYANGSLELPFVGMVLSAGAVVLLPLFSKMASGNDNNIQQIILLWRSAALKAAYLLYPLVAFAWFFSEPIMTFLYGSQYSDSSIYFKIVLIVNFFTIAQYAPILLALGKTTVYSNVLMMAAIIVWGLDYLCVRFIPNPFILTGIGVIVIIAKIFYFLKFISNLLGCGLKELFPIKILIKLCIASIIGAFISKEVTMLFNFSDNPFMVLVIGFILYLSLVMLLSKVFKLNILSAISPLISKLKFTKR